MRKVLDGNFSADSDHPTRRLLLQHLAVFQNCKKDKPLSLRTRFRGHGNTWVATREFQLCARTDNHSLLTITSDTGTRTLEGASYSSNTGMTDEACIAFCQSNNMYWAGTEYSSQCFCGNALDGNNGLAANQGDCNMACSGKISNFATVLLAG